MLDPELIRAIARDTRPLKEVTKVHGICRRTVTNIQQKHRHAAITADIPIIPRISGAAPSFSLATAKAVYLDNRPTRTLTKAYPVTRWQVQAIKANRVSHYYYDLKELEDAKAN